MSVSATPIGGSETPATRPLSRPPRGGFVLYLDEQCEEETWSWWHFTPSQVDPYWIRCTLTPPHDRHEDENTGLCWTTEDGTL